MALGLGCQEITDVFGAGVRLKVLQRRVFLSPACDMMMWGIK